MDTKSVMTASSESSYSISKRSIWSLLGVLALSGFIYLQAVGYIIPSMKEFDHLTKENADISKIGLMWVPIISYVLVSLWVCLTVNIFRKLMTRKQGGLIDDLIEGLVVGVIVGLLVGVPVGSLVWGLVVGPILVLTSSLSAGLVLGLFRGLSKEFS
ncbi:MAG: hypothetical protein U0522_00920 [Candidatus Paceibacterota bacterium]